MGNTNNMQLITTCTEQLLGNEHGIIEAINPLK